MDRHRAPLIRRAVGRGAAGRAGRLPRRASSRGRCVNIVGEGLRGDEGWDLSGVGDVLGDPQLRQVAWFTLWQAAASTVLTLVVALPAAHVLATYEFRGRRFVQALLVVPFVLPTVVVGAAFLSLLGPRRAPSAWTSSGSAWAILLAHAFFNHAVVVRTVGGPVGGARPAHRGGRSDAGGVAVAGLLGGDLARLRPAVASAAAIVFLFTFTSFGVVRILGGADPLDARDRDLPADRRPARPAGGVGARTPPAGRRGAPCSPCTAGSSGGRPTTAVALRAPARPPARDRSRRAAVGRRQPRRSWRCCSGCPLAVLVERSFRIGDGHGLAAWRALAGVDPGSRLFVSPLEAVANSIRFAAVATVLAVVLGGLAAAALARSEGRIARFVDSVLLLPLGTSAVTVGFGFLLALDEPVDLRASPWLVPIAQAVVALPFVVRTMTPVLRSIDPRLRDAAAVLGASPRARVARRRPAPRVAGRAGGRRVRVRDLARASSAPPTVIARADAPTVPDHHRPAARSPGRHQRRRRASR